MARSAPAHATEGTWWKFVGSGVGLFGVIFVVFAPPWPESWRSAVPEEIGYWTVIFGILFSIVLVGVGLLTGIAELAARRHATR